MCEVIDVLSQLVEERDEVVLLIKCVEMRDNKEKACYRLPLVVCQDRNESVRRAKYELVHMMLVLQHRIVIVVNRVTELIVVLMQHT